MSTALQQAVEGKKLNEAQTKGALNQALDKLNNVKKKAEDIKESAGHGVGLAVNALKIHGANFTVSALAAAGGEKVTTRWACRSTPARSAAVS